MFQCKHFQVFVFVVVVVVVKPHYLYVCMNFAVPDLTCFTCIVPGDHLCLGWSQLTMTTIVLKPTPTRDARSSPVLLPQRCGGWCHLYKRPFSFIFTMQGFSAFAYHKSQRVVRALLPPSLSAQQDILNTNKTLTMTVPQPPTPTPQHS